MERLYFVCPITGTHVEAGFETELETLLRIRAEKIRVKCPVCGQHHEWSVSDALLAKAA